MVTTERSEKEKTRRRIYGDKGAKFSDWNPSLSEPQVSKTITTFVTKDILIFESSTTESMRVFSCALRGRGGQSGEKDSWHIRLELGESDISNAVDTVQKDYLLLEIHEEVNSP